MINKSFWTRMEPREGAQSKCGLLKKRSAFATFGERPSNGKAPASSGYASRPTHHLGSKWRKASKSSMAELIVTKKAASANLAGSSRSFVTAWLRAGSVRFPCAIGRGGIKHLKREGDGATPVGRWPLLFGFYRADRGPRPQPPLPLEATSRALGWCDAPDVAAYNRPVALPFQPSHETIWREDGLYDIVIVLGHNLQPRRKNAGSAIFLHCARDDLSPTAGCVALRKADFRRLLPRLSKHSAVVIR